LRGQIARPVEVNSGEVHGEMNGFRTKCRRPIQPRMSRIERMETIL
jgi:hypothetical protein